MRDLANPSIVIGLGGTGQWVLTYLKKNLIDIYGEIPPTVRLLAFDTTASEPEAEVKTSTLERVRVGSVKLDISEFVYLGGNIYEICNEISRENKHPHISSWLQAETYLQAYDYDAYTISKGAGQRRPFGRMAIFYDLATLSPKIIGKIKNAITDVMAVNQHRQAIEIYVVASIVGGTGSGMVIDMAHIIRKLAKSQDISFAIRGFLILPDVFEPVAPISSIQPNAFAALRELDRFMLVLGHDYPIHYSQNPKEPLEIYHSIYRSKLFDSCYLLNSPHIHLSSPSILPKHSVFPAVAESMTALLDPETGHTFSQHYKNINNQLAQAQASTGMAMYSSLGAYTYVLPTEDIIKRNTYKAAIELLGDYLLKIEEDPGNARLTVSSKAAKIDQEPRSAALAFLGAESHTGMLNLHFSQQVASAVGSGEMQKEDYILNIAGIGIGMLDWIIPPVEVSVPLEVFHKVQSALDISIADSVLNSNAYGDNILEAAGRIKDTIDHLRRDILGKGDSEGRRFEGRLQEGLAQLQRMNVDWFRKLLLKKVHLILNGSSGDPLVDKVAKLPYAQEFTQWLAQYFDEFASFLEAVIAARAATRELRMAREYVLTERQRMDESRALNSFLDRLRGTAIKAQEGYIVAEDYLLGLERQEILYQEVLALTKKLKHIADEVKAQCDLWINLLALGETTRGYKQSREIGAYTQLLEEQEEFRKYREEQARIQVYKFLSGPSHDYRYEDMLYDRSMREKWPEVLSRFSWDWEEQDGELELKLSYGGEALASGRSRQDLATDINARLLFASLEPYFYDIRFETVAGRLAELSTPKQLVQDLLDNSRVMVSLEPPQQTRVETRRFVCINRGKHKHYFDTLQEVLQEVAPSDKDNRVIGLIDKHRCIVLSTANPLSSQNTTSYQRARIAYHRTAAADRSLLHIFPAEVNAIWYEQRLPQPPLYQAPRAFSPKITALLENRSMVRRFVLCLFYELLQVEETENGRGQFVLRLDRVSQRDRASVIRLTMPERSPSLLDAMMNFVYSRTGPETGNEKIVDVTPNVVIGVEPHRIDQTLQRRRDSIISGTEGLIEEFISSLDTWDGWLTEKKDTRSVLIGNFRRFVEESKDHLKRKAENRIRDHLGVFLLDIEDCLLPSHRNEVRDSILKLLMEHAGDNLRSGGSAQLTHRIERYINQRQGVIEQLKKSEYETERDLGTIFHLVLWDEIRRLEDGEWETRKPKSGMPRLLESTLDRPGRKHPLHLMTERFLHQADCDITLIRPGIYTCNVNIPSMTSLLPQTVYAHVCPGEMLGGSSIHSVYERVRRIDPEASAVFLVSDQGLTDQGWAQIGTLGMESFSILPIDETLMSEGLAERRERSILCAEVEKRLGVDHNPYDVRDPVADAFSFFGREGLVETVLRHSNTTRHIGIFGLRKLGKSSLLHAVQNRAQFPVALVNLQTFGRNPLKQLYRRILRYWRQWTRVRHELDWELPTISDDDATAAFVSATLDLLDYIDRATGKAHLGLFLDEVELIVPLPGSRGKKLQHYLTFMRAIRGLVDEDGRLSLAVASLDPAISRINSWGGEQNPTFSLLKEIYLPPLTDEHCTQMVRNIGRQAGLVYSDSSLELINELSGGHPFLARQFCSLLYRQRNRQPGEITAEAISPAVERFIYDEQTTTYLDAGIWQDAGKTELWGAVQAEVNQAIISELAQADAPLSKDALLNTPDADTRRTALINLERFHFVHQPEPGYYALRYGLLRTWLRRRKLGME